VPAVSDARFKALVIVGLVVRIGLIAFGLFQDANFAVKYTDVDYEVVSDAAVLMSYGASPFERTTYRYSPLLAALLLPNVWIHKCAGKLLFTAADFLVTVFTRKLVLRALPTSAAAPNAAPLAESETGAGRAPRARRNEQAVANFWALAWWLNPLSANMSSRGNADALVLALILGTVLLLFQRRLLTSALVFGLSVHFRIYPIVYAPALVVFVWLHLTPGTEQRGLTAFWGRRLWRVVQFGLVSGSVFLLLTFGTYSLYGFEGVCLSLIPPFCLLCVSRQSSVSARSRRSDRLVRIAPLPRCPVGQPSQFLRVLLRPLLANGFAVKMGGVCSAATAPLRCVRVCAFPQSLLRMFSFNLSPFW